MLDTMIGKQRYKKTKKCHQFSRNLKYCRIEKKWGDKLGYILVLEGGVIKSDVITNSDEIFLDLQKSFLRIVS